LLEAEVLDAIPAGRPVSIERETFPQLIAAGKPLYAYTTSDYWIDLGTPEAYLAAHRHIFDGAMPLGLQPYIDGPGREGVPTSAVLSPVFVGRNVRVAPDAKIGPYTVLGDDCVVGPGAVVADSLLWDGVVVESGASLGGAIVASRARIGAGAIVGNGSVIGHDADVAPGAVIGEDARIAATRKNSFEATPVLGTASVSD
jgi:mannose-1-phosphate guanylyltransferase